VNCPSCQGEILEIDVKCSHCGAAVGATGAHRMIGQTFLGVYELVDVLGQGGMSVVFKARHKMTDQEVALKILPPELAAHSQVKSRFLEEAKALAALDHANIVHLYNFGQENGSFVLAMQFVPGKTWERAIIERTRLDWKISCRIAVDVLKALEYAHGRGVVHRDMKPSNVLVRESDGAATVMDFGIAKMTTSTKLTATGQTMGTVRYMSPEQVRGQEVDLRTDIYSLGATIYESLVGDTPFTGETHFEIMTKHLSEPVKPPGARRINLPRLVDEAIVKALAKKAADRFDNARDMRKLLEAALKEGDVSLSETQRVNREILSTPKGAARPATASDLADELEPGLTGAVTRPPRRSARSIWIALGVAVLAIGGGTTAYMMSKGSKPAYAARTQIPGVHLTRGKLFDGKLYVETTSAVTPDDVYTAYVAEIADLRAFLDKEGDKQKADDVVKFPDDVVQEIVAIPGGSLCAPQIIRAAEQPCRPSDTSVTALHGKARQIVISDDAGALVSNMRAAVAEAVCDLSATFIDKGAVDTDSVLATDWLCGAAKRFVSAP
jgi:serine/threonine protein kinase